jgi:hypothetical protein
MCLLSVSHLGGLFGKWQAPYFEPPNSGHTGPSLCAFIGDTHCNPNPNRPSPRPPRPCGVGESGPPGFVEKSGTSTPWKLFRQVFHGMEKVIHAVENFFHTVEVPDF